MKALTLKLDLATRLPSLRLPGNVKNYTCCHRGSSRHCFLCSCRLNVNLCWNTPQSKTQFQMYWNICKQAPASVRCHPAWFKSVKLKSKYSHTMHFAPVFDIREWSIFVLICLHIKKCLCIKKWSIFAPRKSHTSACMPQTFPVCEPTNFGHRTYWDFLLRSATSKLHWKWKTCIKLSGIAVHCCMKKTTKTWKDEELHINGRGLDH